MAILPAVYAHRPPLSPVRAGQSADCAAARYSPIASTGLTTALPDRLDRSSSCRGPDEDEAPLGFDLAEATSANPLRKILSAIDLTVWLDELPADDRRMLQLRTAGFTLAETPATLGVSTSNIFARCKRLGSILAEQAGMSFQAKERKVWSARRAVQPASTRRPRSSAETAMRKKMGASTMGARAPAGQCEAI